MAIAMAIDRGNKIMAMAMTVGMDMDMVPICGCIRRRF